MTANCVIRERARAFIDHVLGQELTRLTVEQVGKLGAGSVYQRRYVVETFNGPYEVFADLTVKAGVFWCFLSLAGDEYVETVEQ